MDPIAVAAKERHTTPKRSVEKKELTDFQKALATNPYAQALATPVRQCSLTGARLPSHFLQPFATSFEIESTSAKPSPNVHPKLVPCHASELPRETSAGASAYVLNRRSMLLHLSRRKTSRAGVLTMRMKEAYARKIGKKVHNIKGGQDWGWDADTSERVLNKLREDVMEKMRACLEKQDPMRPSVMHLRDVRSAMDDDVVTAAIPEQMPQGQSTSDCAKQTSSRLAFVYDLSELLDATQLCFLPFYDEDKDETPTVILDHARNTRLHMALYRLAAHLEVKQPERRFRIPGNHFVKMRRNDKNVSSIVQERKQNNDKV